MGTEKTYVGIDVSKETLDVAVHATDRRWRFANSDSGSVTKLVASTGYVLGTYTVDSSPRNAVFDGTNI